MVIVTVITDPNNTGFTRFLLPSCARNNISLVTLVGRNDEFDGYRRKDYVLSQYLDTVDDDEIIFFTDGYDTFFVSDTGEIIEKFKKMRVELLFSAESSCWPDRSLSNQYPFAETPYQFLNSGGFVGYAGHIKCLLKNAERNDSPTNSFPWSNQYLWTRIFLANNHIIKLDTRCEIFCTFSPEVGFKYLTTNEINGPYKAFMVQWFNENFEIKNNRVLNRITGTSPCHLHFNGYSKCLMEESSLSFFQSMFIKSR